MKNIRIKIDRSNREKKLKGEKREERLGKMKIKRETERMVEKKKKTVEAE